MMLFIVNKSRHEINNVHEKFWFFKHSIISMLYLIDKRQ